MIPVDPKARDTDRGNGRHRVEGLVSHHGAPVPGVTVTALARRLRGEDERLGEPRTTDENGRYVIEYECHRKRIDLHVEVRRGKELLATSPVVVGAGPVETINVVVGAEERGPSAFDIGVKRIEAALEEDGVPIAEIARFDEHEIALLSARTGADPRAVVLMKQSAALARDAKLPPELFAALGAEKVALGDLRSVLAQDPRQIAGAVKRAKEQNYVTLAGDAAERALTQLRGMAVDEALRQPEAPGESTLGGLLSVAGVPAEKQRPLVAAYAAHEGSNEEFWKRVRSEGVLTKDEIQAVQGTLHLGVVTQNHLPLIRALHVGGIKTLRDIAKLDREDWLKLIEGRADGQPVGAPPDLKAASVSEKAYADSVYALVEDSILTEMVAARAKRLPQSKLLEQFLSKNSGYRIRATPVAAYLRDHPDALDWLRDKKDRAKLLKTVKGIERLAVAAPRGTRIEVLQALLKDGVDSSQKIATIGRAAFVRRYEGTLGSEIAKKTYARANHAAATTAMLMTRHGAMFDGTPMYVLASRPDTLKGSPDYKTLFGSLDFCTCEHCQSIYSPAAYLVDLLHWLDLRDSKVPGKNALDILFDGRRADIGTIELSCKNTNTPLPYVDLVNEVLELTVEPPNPLPAYQTTGSASDLLVHPEHLHAPAYEVLAGANAGKVSLYPFHLPFNLWLDEARTYLGQLGLPRHRLMESLYQTWPGALVDSSIAIESLELSPGEAQVVAGTLNPLPATADFWGLSGDPNWKTTLSKVSAVLDRAAPPLSDRGMEFEELLDLLRTDFIQKPAAVGVWFDGMNCDTTKAQLVGAVDATFERMHRFVRLERRLGWSAADLDRAIQVLGAGTLDEPFFVNLSHVLRLKRELDLSVSELLSWWGPIDTRRWRKRMVLGRPAGIPPTSEGRGFVFDSKLTPTADPAEDQSPYDVLFQSRTVTAEPSTDFHIRQDGAALANETHDLADYAPEVAAALGVTQDYLAKLTSQLPDTKLSLANLSALYRHTSLARALELTIGQLLSLLALCKPKPFDAAHTEDAVQLVEELRAIRESGFTVEELDYLLRHVDTKPATLEPQPESIGIVLLEIRDALRKAGADHPDPDPSGGAAELRELLAKELAGLVSPDELKSALALVDLEPGTAPPANANQIIDTSFAEFLDTTQAKKKLAQPGDAAYLSSRTDRLFYVLAPLAAYRRRLASESAVIEKLGSALAIDPAVTAPILREHILHPGPGGQPVMTVFLDAALVSFEKKDPASDAPLPPTSADLPAQFQAYLRLHKVALIVTRLGVLKEEVPWVFVQGPGTGTLDFNTLPLQPPAPAPAPAPAVPYAEWARLRDAFWLRNRIAGGKLLDLFGAAASATPANTDAMHEALLLELEKRTRWDRDDIEFLVGAPARTATPAKPSAFGFVYPNAWKDERALKRVASVMTVVRRIGLSAETVWPWRMIPAAVASQQEQADAVKQAVRARYTDGEWRETARPLRDRLRERQRDALAGWLLGNHAKFKSKNVNALFEHLLLDVQMSPCQLTSRIKQAISSTQLFVQRALMNLEPDVSLPLDDAREWKWRKSYRVWEANRKVFLYPENWLLEPRDDKTPQFKELENELLQDDITDESAEKALRAYLEQLDEIARLEVVGVFHQKEDDLDILHVIGRTRGQPHRYFCRQRVDGKRWEPWEKIGAELEGEHILPVIYNRRLYVFWLQVTDVAVEEPVDTPSQAGVTTAKPPERYYQLRLGYVERRDSKWSKKLSKDQVGATVDDYDRLTCGISKTPQSSPHDFFLRSFEDDAGDLIIEPIRYVRAGSKKGKDKNFHVRLDRYRLSGCDGTLTLDQRSDASSFTIRAPDSTATFDQTFARTSYGGTLVLPARNPFTGAFEKQDTLGSTPWPFEVVPPKLDDFQSSGPFFFQDLKRSFFVEPYDAFS